jgi:hypothetical protein
MCIQVGKQVNALCTLLVVMPSTIWLLKLGSASFNRTRLCERLFQCLYTTATCWTALPSRSDRSIVLSSVVWRHVARWSWSGDEQLLG